MRDPVTAARLYEIAVALPPYEDGGDLAWATLEAGAVCAFCGEPAGWVFLVGPGTNLLLRARDTHAVLTVCVACGYDLYRLVNGTLESDLVEAAMARRRMRGPL